MSRLWARFAGLFSNRALVGMDKAGNRYFARTEEMDGVMKEKRWVLFKGEQEPTSIPVEWICWLNGQRNKAPTPEEIAELEARRESVRLNVAVLKKEEEERKARGGATKRAGTTARPDLKSFIQQFPVASEGEETKKAADATNNTRIHKVTKAEIKTPSQDRKEPPESTEPSGSGESFRPGVWQPPT